LRDWYNISSVTTWQNMSTSADDSDVLLNKPPRRARRSHEERRHEAEQRLLEAAREIVASKGWTGLTLAEVGEAAGYSRGIATHRFGSKGGLLRALATFIHMTFMSEVNAAPARQPGLDALLGFVTVYLSRSGKSWTNTRALLRLLADANVDGSDTGDFLTEYNREVLGFVESQIRTGVNLGNIRQDVSPNAGAVLVMGALRGVMLQKLLERGEIEVSEVRDEFLRMLRLSFAAS